METKLEQIAVKAVNHLSKSVVREIRTPRSVGAGGGRPPPATRWARGNSRPYREDRLLPLLCRFSDAGMPRPSPRSDSRRPKSAKARNRGVWGTWRDVR